MNINEILIVVLIIAVIYVSTNKVNKENLYIYPKCDRIKPFINKYHESYYDSNVSNGFECYKKCLDAVDCQYVGVALDCQDFCFNNLGKSENNTLGDFNQ